jgi:hypothetical protein
MDVQLSTRMRQALDRFCRQYLQLHLKLDYPDAEYLCYAAFQEALYVRLFQKDSIQHPPPNSYQFRVLKELVKRIEQSIQNWDEEVSVYGLVSFTSDVSLSLRI